MSNPTNGMDAQQFQLMMLLSKMGQQQPNVQTAPVNSLGAGIGEGVNNVMKIVMERRAQNQQAAVIQALLGREASAAKQRQDMKDSSYTSNGLNPNLQYLDPDVRARLVDNMFPNAEARAKIKEAADKEADFNSNTNDLQVAMNPNVGMPERIGAYQRLMVTAAKTGHALPGLEDGGKTLLGGNVNELMTNLLTHGNPKALNTQVASPELLNSFSNYKLGTPSDALTQQNRYSAGQKQAVEASGALPLLKQQLQLGGLGITGKQIENGLQGIQLDWNKDKNDDRHGELNGTLKGQEAQRRNAINNTNPTGAYTELIKTPNSGFKGPNDFNPPVAPQPQTGPSFWDEAGQVAGEAPGQVATPLTTPLQSMMQTGSNYFNMNPQQQQQNAYATQQNLLKSGQQFSDNASGIGNMLNPSMAPLNLVNQGLQMYRDYHKGVQDHAGKMFKALDTLINANPPESPVQQNNVQVSPMPQAAPASVMGPFQPPINLGQP